MLSIIYADTYDDSYGSTIEIFGIADNEEQKEKICEMVRKKGYKPEVIENMQKNQYNRRYIGGYCE